MAWTPIALAADVSAVDRSFSSKLATGGSVLSTQLWPLHDGGAVVKYQSHPSLGGFYTHYYHVDPTGQEKVVWSSGYYVGISTPGPDVATVLADGSLVMPEPPFRRDAQGAEIASFSLPPGFRTISRATLQPDGKLLLADGAQLARLLPDGAVDSSFAADTSPLTSIATIHVDGAGRLVIGNSTRAIRLTKTGALDASFAPIADPGFPGVIAVTTEGAVTTSAGRTNPTTKRLEYIYTRYRADGSPEREWNIQPWAGTTDPTRIAVAPAGEIFVPTADGIIRLTGGPTPQVDPSFFARSDRGASIYALAMLPDGKLLVFGEFKSWEGFATTSLVRLDPTRTLTIAAPVVTLTSPPTLQASYNVVVQSRVDAFGPLTYTWSSLDGGVLPADIHSSSLVFNSFQRENIGRYQLQVTSPGGTTRVIIDLRPRALPPRLMNVSARAPVGSGEDTLIAGITVDVPPTGRPLRLVLRGVGPALALFGVTNPVRDPLLTLRGSRGEIVAQNDNWSPEDANRAGYYGGGYFASGSADSLLAVDAQGGAYTVQFEDRTGAGGTGLIEVYDIDLGDPLTTSLRDGALANLSLRGRVSSAADPLTAGFVVLDPTGLGPTMKILVRVAGPSLRSLGITNALTNPRLTVFDWSGTAIATNDDWQSSATAGETAAAIARTGAFPFPAGSKDAALVLDVSGAYTVQAASADGSSGIAIVEVYRVP